jgi:hypothetical protein
MSLSELSLSASIVLFIFWLVGLFPAESIVSAVHIIAQAYRALSLI